MELSIKRQKQQPVYRFNVETVPLSKCMFNANKQYMFSIWLHKWIFVSFPKHICPQDIVF